MSPTATFHSGDMVRVKVEGNRDGYLYVIRADRAATGSRCFRRPTSTAARTGLVAHRGYRLPSDTQAFTFDEQAGQEQLFVIYSPEPVKDMDALIPSLGSRREALPPTS